MDESVISQKNGVPAWANRIRTPS